MQDREKRLTEFYNNPDNKNKSCCDNCVRELLLEEVMRSTEVAGLQLCPVCLEEDQKKASKTKSCTMCKAVNVELLNVADSDVKNICVRCFQNIKGGENMGELSDYAKRNSQFVSLNDEESIEAVYRGFKIGANQFDPEKETVNYKLETEYGIKTFRSGATGLARLFDNIEEGAKIRITRHGEGTKTSYTIEQDSNGEWVAVGKEVED